MVTSSKLMGSMVLACALSLGAQASWAMPLGNGLSVGQVSPVGIQRVAAAPAAPGVAQSVQRSTSSAPAAAPPRTGGGLLGGLAAGLGLAWLATALGFGEIFGQLLLLALVAVVVLAALGLFWRRRAATAPPGLAYQAAGGAAGSSQFDPATPRGYNAKNVGNDASARPWEHQDGAADASAGFDSTVSDDPSWGVPEGFDSAGFLKASKANFVSLQEAWDRSDIPALRAMMTDGMLDQIKVQLAEREQAQGGSVNRTDVVMLEARLLGIEEFPEGYMASVEFSGLIREDVSSGPNPFREVWSITRPRSGPGGWLVAGVQALQ